MELDEPEDVVRQRRHKQLLYLIENYHLTQEQEDYLRSIKNNTQLEIASRFRKSKHNQNYKFPLMNQQGREQEEYEDMPTGFSFDNTVYDLKSQNYDVSQEMKQIKQKPPKTKRVKSLGNEKLNQKIQRDIKLQLRERPQARGNNRKALLLPSIGSQRVLTHVQPKSIMASSSQKLLFKGKQIYSQQSSPKKTNNYQRIQHILAKDHNERKMGQLVGHKLLTESNDLISFGKAKVNINKLRLASPVKRGNPSKKLITQ